MTEERQPDSMAGATGTTGDAVVSSGAQSVEEVEAFWRHRQSQNDRAHAAETAALRAQFEELKRAPAPSPEGESPDAARVRALEGELQQERMARQALQLQTRYPQAASVLGESIAALPEEKLAAIEASYEAADNGGPPMIDRNAAPRAGTGVQSVQQKPLNEKTKDELLADLQQLEPVYQQEQRDR